MRAEIVYNVGNDPNKNTTELLMSQKHHIIVEKKGQHLDYARRKIIEVMLKKGFKASEIAEAVGISASTLSSERRRGEVMQTRVFKEPELKRNYYRGKTTEVCEWAYSAAVAQADADAKSVNSCKRFKLLQEAGYVEFIESLILSDSRRYSPDIANALAKQKGYKGVSTKTLYNWIDAGLLKIQPMDLLLKVRRKKQSKARVQKRIYGKSIDERPKEVENRVEFGHWEGDSIIGKNQQGQIITLIERKHRIGFMFKFKDKKARNMVLVLRKLKKRYGESFGTIFKSITFDNGSEFAYNTAMSRYTRIYYAHAYRACERGSNEHFNGIVRRFIPKGKDFADLKQSDINRINHYINTMPRRLLGYKTPLELFRLETTAA